MVNSINISDRTNRKYQTLNTAVSSAASVGVLYGSNKLLKNVCKKYLYPDFSTIMLTENEKQQIIDKADDILKSDRFKNFGIKIEYVDENSPLAGNTKDITLQRTIEGKNAFYRNGKRTVFINKKLLNPMFHELGHAKSDMLGINPKTHQLTKFLGGKKTFLYLPILAMCTTSKKRENGQKLTTADKIINSLRICAAPLALTAWMPRLFEEKFASKNGEHMIKDAGFDKVLLKKIKITHTRGFLSYAAAATLSAGTIALGIKSKDFFMEKLPKLATLISGKKESAKNV